MFLTAGRPRSGIAIGAIGIDVLRHAAKRLKYLALAALPLLPALHQFDETFVWRGLQGHVPQLVGHSATRIYLVVAFVILPIYVPVTVHLGNYHLSYHTGLGAGTLGVRAYVFATCGSLLFSGYRGIAIIGMANLIAVAVLAQLAIDGFASLWCAWAAIASGAVALQVRFGGPHRNTVRALT